MSAAYIEIRRLTQADAVLYRDIRLKLSELTRKRSVALLRLKMPNL